MVAQYFASFLLTSAILLLNPQFFQNENGAGNGEIRQAIETGSGENIRLNGQWERQGALGATECKLSSICILDLDDCTEVCRESSNMKPTGSWVPSDRIQTSSAFCYEYGQNGRSRDAFRCKCCKK